MANNLRRGFSPTHPSSAVMSVCVEVLAKLKAHRWQVSCLDFGPDGSKLASGSWDREVHIWDLNNLKVLTTLKEVHQKPVTSLSWQTPHGQLLCTGSADHTAVLWNPESGAQLSTLSKHGGWVLGNCFSASGSVLATASWDKTIGIWDPGTGGFINSLNKHTAGSVVCPLSSKFI